MFTAVMKKLNKKHLYGILIIGTLILLLSSGQGTSESDESVEHGWDYDRYVKELETHLEKSLNQIQGVSEAETMITLESGFEYVPAYETGSDKYQSEGGEQKKLIVLKKKGGTEEAFVLKECLPKIQGVIVIAKGVGNSETERDVVEAIKTLFDISSSRVKVLAK